MSYNYKFAGYTPTFNALDLKEYLCTAADYWQAGNTLTSTRSLKMCKAAPLVEWKCCQVWVSLRYFSF